MSAPIYGEQRKIRLTMAVVVKGRPGVAVGDEFEVPIAQAHDMVTSGWAEWVLPKGAKAGAIETREPIVDSRDPAIVDARIGVVDGTYQPVGQTPPKQSGGRKTPK